MTMENAGHFQSQLTSLMNAVVTAAVVEIVRIVEDSAVVLRQQLSKSKLENEALKVENESNKKKLQILEDELVHTKDDGKGEKTGAGLQSQDPAGQSQWKLLKVVTMEKDGMKVLRIKKEINDHTERDTPSPVTDEQLCPKVDMVFVKEWSQSLWRDDRIDSKDRTEEETPGSSMTQHQNGGLLQCSKLNPSTPILKVFCDPERDTYPDYRLKRESLNYLFSLALTGQDRQTATFKILVFIYWLAHGTSYKTVSETFGIPLSNATSIVRDVADKLVKLSLKIVNKPSSGELALTMQGFGRLARHPVFEKAVGAIGGCHVRVKIPGVPQPQQRPGDQPLPEKALPTINFQGVCDHTGSFIDVFAGLPGSMTDVRILRHSPLYKCALYPPPGCFLLGDGRYPCLQTPVCIITPYSKSDQNPVHVQFNQHHAMALSSIERTFGIMKKRWHMIFLQPLELHPSFIPKVLAVCTVLHNICLRSGDLLEPVKIEDRSKVTEALKEWLASNETSGEALRDSLAQQISTMKCMATVKDERGTSAPANMMAVQKEHAYNIVVMEH
ncbi:putative nuclease HARBI1 isoform X2 [Oncorhynchus kisutch]|uniref:putative nuclease HARBI1 isoform X2 n=1 Tax=Oncorhynchus kisutch TaxID=8019 RepID=UPI0009A04172|nr:putative nuclease HARBI1 isoform X2 [Oncorhynchus kisutch]